MKNIFKSFINGFILKPFALKIYSTKAFGRESCSDIKQIIASPKTLFDVGANVGQTASLWHEEFPEADIHSFEPVARLHKQLEDNCGKYARCNHLGVGDECGELKIHYGKHDVSHSFSKDDQNLGGEVTSVVTVDSYCKEHNIERIDLLKIDVEGFEPQVIKGASGLLAAQKVDLILVELGFDPNGYYVFYPEFAELLSSYKYSTLGFYDQTTMWDGATKLLFANVLFARENLNFAK